LGSKKLGWGVGGIEAEAGMLGQPSYFPIPEVIGVRLTNSLPQGIPPTPQPNTPIPLIIVV
jgi:aconitate hydratase